MLSLDDFHRHAQDLPGADLSEQLQRLVARSKSVSSDKPEAVGQIMDSQPPVVRVDQPLAEAVELFAGRAAAEPLNFFRGSLAWRSGFPPSARDAGPAGQCS